MSEAVLAPRSLPLDRVHKSLGADMFERDGWLTPSSYGDQLFEYAAVRERGAGLIDLSARGRLLVTGSEAVAFLNGLITNDMKTLEENRWMAAVFPNVQGRLIASVRISRLADDNKGKPIFLIDTEAATHDRVLQTIQKFTLAGDFYVTDLTAETAHLSVQGKQTASIVRASLGVDVAGLSDTAVTRIDVTADDVSSMWDGIIIASSHTGAKGFDLISNATRAVEAWNKFVSAGAQPVGYDAWEILRVEAGVPRYGQDMDEVTVVTETNLDEAVSYTKGCYVGQEIIARIKYRGHVAKKLRGLLFEEPFKTEDATAITSTDAKEIGRLTSTTHSPHLGRRIALGYVKYEYISPGTEVKAADGHLARVVDLPFISSAAGVTS